MARPKKETPQEPLEKQLWSAADKLRKNLDAADYKHVVLGLIFLKYISDSFESLRAQLVEGKGEFEGADPEDRDEYKAKNVFFVPQPARWNWLRDNAKKPDIGVLVDAAMDAIEKDNPALKGVLPKVYARDNLDPATLGALIDLVSGIALGDAKARSADVLGHVFEYFLGEFALAEGKKGGLGGGGRGHQCNGSGRLPYTNNRRSPCHKRQRDRHQAWQHGSYLRHPVEHGRCLLDTAIQYKRRLHPPGISQTHLLSSRHHPAFDGTRGHSRSHRVPLCVLHGPKSALLSDHSNPAGS